ncbi:MAG: glucose 1-dehydrogenase [Deltaproteobacteria bacterium]|nr:glucose 1-dehydrogenase [Deltaproteobacteria bacterium]
MDLGLKGKTAIVTGGASNIGRGISLILGAEGANVIIADLDEKQAEKTVNDIKTAGGEAMAIKTDITGMDAVEAMVKKTIDRYGKVDILVNNAGWDSFAFFVDTTPDLWDKIIKINYVGMMNCTKAVLKPMIAQKSGAIVSISSDSSRVGGPREAVYSGVKGAINSLSKTLARENGRFGIRVNVVSPGATPPKPEDIGEKSMHYGVEGPNASEEGMKALLKLYPLGRVATPKDIGNAVAFLSSDAASFITGQIISVSGGYCVVG